MVYLSDRHRSEALRPGKDSDLDHNLLPALQQGSSPIAPVPQMLMSSAMDHRAVMLAWSTFIDKLMVSTTHAWRSGSNCSSEEQQQ